MNWFGGFIALSFALSSGVTYALRAWARRKQLLDMPNQRSSHTAPTPRLGGVGIVLCLLFVSGPLFAIERGAELSHVLAVLGGTAVISVLGLADDLRGLSARLKLAVQLATASMVVLAAGSGLDSGFSALSWLPRPVLFVLVILWITWLTNLYNFMDGIDGLAGGQAVAAFVGLAGAAMATTGAGAFVAASLCAASATLGFLAFNFPRASIFMGDAGSTALGFFFGCLPLLAPAGVATAGMVTIALSLFIGDATFTLVRRVLNGKNPLQAHRSHLYQRPLRHGVRHRTITATGYAGMVVVTGATVWFSRSDSWHERGLTLGIAAMTFFVLAMLSARTSRLAVVPAEANTQ